MNPKSPSILLLLILAHGVMMTVSRAGNPASDVRGPDLTPALWPEGKMPGKAPATKERETPARGDGVIRLTDIHEPSLSVFKAPDASKPAPAVIICPGGGYNILAWNKEGTEVAAWLNSIGVTGIVLKYRVPGNREGAWQDVQRAMRLVRHRAGEWNLVRDKIGVMGFSAGGHLSARLATTSGEASYPKLDGVDEQPLRPDFAVLVYPAYLSDKEGKLPAELPVTAKMPPVFMVHTEDDRSFIAGSKVFHAALQSAKVPNGFFLSATGGHGYGLRAKGDAAAWPAKCQEWLEGQGILQKK